MGDKVLARSLKYIPSSLDENVNGSEKIKVFHGRNMNYECNIDWEKYNGLTESKYEDTTFGATKDLTLYWGEYLIDKEMYNLY